MKFWRKMKKISWVCGLMCYQPLLQLTLWIWCKSTPIPLLSILLDWYIILVTNIRNKHSYNNDWSTPENKLKNIYNSIYIFATVTSIIYNYYYLIINIAFITGSSGSMTYITNMLQRLYKYYTSFIYYNHTIVT